MMMWQRLAAALEYYKGCGFVYREVPWIVSEMAIDQTCPPGYAIEVHRDSPDRPLLGYLIGSGEQGFIEEALDGALPRNEDNLMTITPCFRVESEHNVFVKPYFMKLELFSWNIEPRMMAFMAQKFFQRWYHPIDLIETEIGWDLQYAGIEIGSYGVRHVKEVNPFTYGTGLAEPRFTNIKGTL